jgi:hypothetical protein
MERRSFLAAASALAAVAAGASPSLAQPKGDSTSDNNLIAVRNRLESYINQLRRDARDFGGHRGNAIDWLQRAINELTAAVRYDQTHS